MRQRTEREVSCVLALSTFVRCSSLYSTRQKVEECEDANSTEADPKNLPVFQQSHPVHSASKRRVSNKQPMTHSLADG